MKRLNRKPGRVLLVFLLALSLMAGAGSALADGGTNASRYTYRLFVTDYMAKDDGSYELQLGLYVFVGGTDIPMLDGGSFGLRVPTNVSARFEASGNISLLQSYGSARDGKLAFIWTCSPTADRGVKAEITGKNCSVFGTDLKLDTIPGGMRMFVGTFKLTISEFPARSSVGLLDWSKTAESADPVFSTSIDGHSLNDEVWNGTSRAYQGYYQDTELNMQQTDVPLTFSVPAYWPNAFSVLSYDPKKPISVTLSDENGEVADANFTVPQWETTTTADSGTLYAAADANRDTGTGAYYAAVDMGDGVLLTADKTYTLTFSKPGHLRVRYTLTGTGGDITEATGFPEEAVFLPAGNINGDGRIDMADRAALLGVLGVSWQTTGTTAYYADIDGDGRVTMADLSILMSPMNYTKKAG